MASSSKATINDVAKLAGVSIKTVSRVVNREPNVRPTTQVKVEEAIRRLQYRPNLSARNLASTRARLILLVYDDPGAYETPSTGFITSMQQGALFACKENGYELLIHPCHYRDKGVREELTRVIERTRPTGIVLAAPLSNMPDIVETVRRTGVPFVPLSRGKDCGDEFAVATNDRIFSCEMTSYLASLGHKRIGFICGNQHHAAVANRYRGYQDGLADAGLELDESIVVRGDNSIGSGEAGAAELLDRDNPPTAIFAANDDMAAGVIREALRRGISIPGQLSVAGCDDTSLAKQIYPSLTTIHQPLAEMAQTATEALIDDNSSDPGILVVPAEIRVRESTGPARKD